jgi:hypothetical protein
MTRRQKRIVAALAFANIIVLLAFIVLGIRRFSSSTALPPAVTDRPETPTATSGEARPAETPRRGDPSLVGTIGPEQSACEWKAAQLMAQVGLVGTVLLSPGGSLCFDITHPLAPDQAFDQAAQSAWTAFDIAIILRGSGTCTSFTEVQITIMAEGEQGDARITASASTKDLVAFGAGELSETEFIERVDYATHRPP